MKFRVTIEQLKHPDDGYHETPYWSQILQQEIAINVAELAARKIEKITQDACLNIDSSAIRKVLFEELHEEED